MYLDCQKEEDVKRLLTRVQYLIDKKKKVEITEKQERRTNLQNSYLHLILTWFAIEYGETLQYIKENYFKQLCSPDLFIRSKDDKFKGTVQYLRSSADLDKSEMTIAIDRFRNWSSKEAGIYLPEANEDKFLLHIQQEMKRNRVWT